MPKYYVQSYDLHHIIAADNPVQAVEKCMKILSHCKPDYLVHECIAVSEVGFMPDAVVQTIKITNSDSTFPGTCQRALMTKEENDIHSEDWVFPSGKFIQDDYGANETEDYES